MRFVSSWEGPFAFFPDGEFPSMYEAKRADEPGVYLWTVPIDGVFWVNYIGIHRYSMLDRNTEHLRLFLGGRYTVYDARKLLNKEKSVGFYGNANMQEFLSSYPEYHKTILDQIKIMTLFFAPFPESDISVLKRIESALLQNIRNDDLAVGFLDNERLSVNVPKNERDLEIEISRYEKIKGINESFYA